ncbi:MAG: phosphoribosylglycinamide formyltransferase [Chiayiivirga sp.]|jgi:phosphoribosylglycinamide formyltransferase-1|uniref:phosphoribosylglycinamide formyltransferase n=1 Tax=Chiayiivirga sp. TaxID=2041042 RepID=UPI0025C05D33|nr:phosphoribosylglycinamide formyltransferase [Chiayiivirga sp.]MCI1709047.1 phosphoribosylglycinamide formyltransferase [Chiayiivirga sp.]MCI1729338.1 phosphoribosylglycinamide formyltransferase [Chiayiivirga sp.]
MTLRVAVLASGRGSHFVSLADAAARGELPIRVVGVFSDKPAAPVLQRAAERGVPSQVFEPRRYVDRTAHEAALFAAVDAAEPELIVCAGYMRILGAAVVTPRSGRMLNIHPSLLPRHRGLHTHRRALEAGDAEHGASVHFVTAELDGGPVLAQARVAVQPGDDEATLAQRVLEREHPLLRACVGLFAAGRIALREDGIELDQARLPQPLQLQDDNHRLSRE